MLSTPVFTPYLGSPKNVPPPKIKIQQALDQFEAAWNLRQNDRERALALAQETYGHYANRPLSEADARLLHGCHLLFAANYAMQTGHLAEGLPQVLEAHALFQQLGQTTWLSRVLNLLGIFYIQLGNRTLAMEYWLANAKLAEAQGKALDAARAYHNLGWLPYQAGDYEAATVYFERSLPEVRQAGNHHHLVLNLCNLATCRMYGDAFAAAAALLDEAAALCEQDETLLVEQNVVWQRWGLLAEKEGDVAGALAYYEQALAITAHTPDPFSRIPNLHALARLHLEHGRGQEALPYLEEALHLSQHADRKQYLYDTHELFAKLYQASGQFDKALDHFQQFHAIRTEVFNETNEQTVHNLRIMHQTETVRREAEMLKTQNVQLEVKVAERTKALEMLVREREALAQKLALTLAREEELSELKSQILTTVSHEFRTPLTVINTSADLLRRYLPTAVDNQPNPYYKQQQKHLGRIQDAVVHITDLLDDIVLIHSMTHDSQRHTNPTRYQFNALCAELQQHLQTETEAPPHLRFEFDAQDESQLCVDSLLLKQILLNLLSNALKYSSTESEVVVASYLDTAVAQLVVQVRDGGIGIPLAEREKVFELFYRGSNAQDLRGLGLGLFVVRELVRLMGGEITADVPADEVGSVFTVRLPVVCAG